MRAEYLAVAAEPISVSELAKRLGLLLSSTSTIVGELSRAGLLERAEDEHDRRRTIVRVHEDYRAAMEGWLEIALAPIRDGVLAIPVPGHTRGSVVYLLEERYLFTGDSLAWSEERKDLVAFRDACWYSWEALTESLAALAAYRFEWVLPGHGWSVQLPAREMQKRLRALIARMKR